MTSTEKKLADITAAVVRELKSSCGECSSEMIDNQFFVCYPESPSFLTYRARLEGTRETDSDSLISLIEEWVRGGVSLIVTGVLMTVDPHCSVAISSPDQPECSPVSNTQPPTNSSSTFSTETSSVTTADRSTGDTADRSTGDDFSSTTTAIIGGVVVAIVLIIVVAIVIIIIALLVLKSHCGGFSVKNPGKKYVLLLLLKLKCLESLFFCCRYGASGGGISTSTNEAYGKVVAGEREEGYEMVEVSHRDPPAKLEEMYEVPMSPPPPPPSQPLPTITLPPTAGAEEDIVYDVIPGDQ